MQTVVMPKMGDTMEEGKILAWRKKVGDPVARGDSLAEIETDKVNIEAESFAEGVLRKILVQEGESAAVGAPIALVGAPDEALPDDNTQGPSAQPAQAQQEPAPQREPVPATVGSAYQPAREPAGTNGGTNGASSTVAAPATEAAGRVIISPIAKRIAQEHHLDIARIAGTGPNGRIIKDDVEAALTQQGAPVAQPVAQPAVQLAPQIPAQPLTPIPAAAEGEEVEAVALSAMRKTIARRLQQSMQTAPHFYLTLAIDTTKLAELRATINEYAETLPEPIKVSMNDLIVKGVALALVRVPQVNVSFDGERLLFKKRINVGVAVALEQGLIVPVIRDADRRGVLDLARESRRLVDAARTGKLKPEEFQGGTFSVSNLGMFEIEEFTAVINPPESAILAVGAIQPTPVVVDGQVVVRDRMKVTLSVDHRALDGATGARFLQELKRLLESPMGLLV
ncbi:MAG TPA: dihydrolipoamide acetyltransferase family protein [Ktedonobacterales bacterium]|jgi:pyruvate dehydrogenase E2 component (dihydrolipoamide acetyltransferase)